MSFHGLIVERILAIKIKEGTGMKNTLKWKDVKFRNKHISELENDDFADGWIPASEILDFYDKVNRQFNKAY
jgi:hypothetical protein